MSRNYARLHAGQRLMALGLVGFISLVFAQSSLPVLRSCRACRRPLIAAEFDSHGRAAPVLGKLIRDLVGGVMCETNRPKL